MNRERGSAHLGEGEIAIPTPVAAVAGAEVRTDTIRTCCLRVCMYVCVFYATREYNVCVACVHVCIYIRIYVVLERVHATADKRTVMRDPTHDAVPHAHANI